MKHLYIFILLGTFVHGQSDVELLLNNTWHLVEFNNECFGITPENPDEFDINNITLNFYDYDDHIHYITEMCTRIEGGAYINNSEIEFITMLTEGPSCENPINFQYDKGYQCAMSTKYDYSITENSDGTLTLYMENDIFMSAVYTTQLLFTEEFNYNNFSIYPNPVKDKLTFENPDLKITQIQITDAEGKLILEQKINSVKTEIDFSALSKGIYFIRIESDGKIIKTEKVIKY